MESGAVYGFAEPDGSKSARDGPPPLFKFMVKSTPAFPLEDSSQLLNTPQTCIPHAAPYFFTTDGLAGSVDPEL
jgi:hypothetical protein